MQNNLNFLSKFIEKYHVEQRRDIYMFIDECRDIKEFLLLKKDLKDINQLDLTESEQEDILILFIIYNLFLYRAESNTAQQTTRQSKWWKSWLVV